MYIIKIKILNNNKITKTINAGEYENYSKALKKFDDKYYEQHALWSPMVAEEYVELWENNTLLESKRVK